MEDATDSIESKMRAAGVHETAIRAFLYQYGKLVRSESGLIPEETISPIDSLPETEHRAGLASQLLDDTIILKLNGGLGTSMGLEGPKSLLRVRSELSFLDIIVRQFLAFRKMAHADLFWMNSFSTSSGTLAALRQYPELGDPLQLEILQNKVPKIDQASLAPVSWPENPQLEWCPPGHGDLYPALGGSGFLDRWLSNGKKYLFVSNADNLGATLDLDILSYFAENTAPFLMEVTRRTEADRKGGHLAFRTSDRRMLLRESAQCPEEDLESFQDIDRYRYFNTNTLWIRLEPLRDALKQHAGYIPLPLIRNEKTVDPRNKKSIPVYQLETAMGAAVEFFAESAALQVSRSRFAPVKTTNDLLALRSDAYEVDESANVRLSPERGGQPPIVKLGDEYKIVDQMESLLERSVPSLRECQSLTIEGPWVFAENVKILGQVNFVNRSNERKVIDSGVYQDQTVEV